MKWFDDKRAKLFAFTQRSELSRFLWAFRREFSYAFCFTALINVLMLTPTLYMLQIFDRVLVSHSEFTLLAVTLMLFFFVGVMSFSEWVRGRLLVRLGVRLDLQLNARVFAAAFEMQSAGRDKEAAQLTGDLAKVRQFLTGAGLFALLDAPWSPIFIVVLYLLHPALGVLGIVFCLILAGLSLLSGKALTGPLEEAGKVSQQESLYITGKMRHAAAVEAMGMLPNMQSAWQKRHQSALAYARRGADTQARVQSVTRFVRMFQQSLCLGAGALLVIFGQLTAGAMIAANALMSRATHPLDALMNAWKGLLDAKRAYLELEQALEAYPPREAVTVTAETVGAAMSLRHVRATAENRAMPILEDVSFELTPGMALGIMGPSGSGKSTLARVMLGIWPRVEGEVLYEGAAIREQERNALGAELGYLPQDVELFDGTIAANIARFGEIDPEAVVAASQMAGVHDMILRFPKGYDTPIGDGGRFLSGGQRQRIGLARALYGRPRLIVLDEPNANLDDAGDRALYQAVHALKQHGVTLVLISHRPQIMTIMDRVLVLENGKVAHFGRPQLAEVAPPRERPAPPAIGPLGPAPMPA